MSADDLKRAVEDAEKAATSLKNELKRAKALVEETRARLERQVAPELRDAQASLGGSRAE